LFRTAHLQSLELLQPLLSLLSSELPTFQNFPAFLSLDSDNGAWKLNPPHDDDISLLKPKLLGPKESEMAAGPPDLLESVSV